VIRVDEAVFRRAGRGVLFCGVTPPRAGTDPQRVDEIAQLTLDRLAGVEPDAVILYDVDAENDRSAGERPFPFVPMMDPAQFLAGHLGAWPGPVVVYRAVGKYAPDELAGWFARADPRRVMTVLVGASSAQQEVRTRLDDAYRLHADGGSRLALGGVLIAERHAARGDEHERMLRKQAGGCSFFVSQICYDVDHSRDVLSDYLYACRERGLVPRPVVATLAPCGSARTLAFMSWLGVAVPHWLRNEIVASDEPLAESFEQCLESARSLVSFCRRRGLPFGINVESVTNRKVEIDASIELAREVRGLLGRP